VIKAPAERVWALIRDFGALPDWHPVIVSSQIERGEPADKIGCIRDMKMQDGGRVREQLLALSDFEYFFTYSILESSLGVDNYIATFRLIPITDGNHTFAEWSAEFDCAQEAEAELVEGIGGDVFQGGFESLKRKFGG
jgi:hypothetical protein